jgi:DNA-binding transcriptional MerR regulator
MRISELAESAGVPTTTVRYYERIGLLPPPVRTASGYRDFDDAAAARLLYSARARRMGLSCDQITALLAAWSGDNCSAAHGRVVQMIEDKQADIARRVAELQQFGDELEGLRADLLASPPPSACRADLSCCVPDSPGLEVVPLELTPRGSLVGVRAGRPGTG